jgi:thioesterase domain-containing protein
VIELKPGEQSASTLFLVHPVGGYAHCYAELAGALRYPGAVYGLQADSRKPLATIEAMARDYLGTVQRVQGSGPYLLGGWSMGGMVAYEMARLLRAQDEQVGLLLMLDTVCPQYAREHADASPPHDPDKALLAAIAAELAIELDASSEEHHRTLADQTLPELKAMLLELGKQQGRLPKDFTTDEFDSMFALLARNSAAARDYSPPTFGAEIQLIRAKQNQYSHRSLGWDSVAAHVTVKEQAGSHFTLLRRPQVFDLAKVIDDALRAASMHAAPAVPVHQYGQEFKEVL